MFPTALLQIHSLPGGGAFRVPEIQVPPVTLYTKQRSAHKCCFIRITCKIKWKWHRKVSEDSRISSEIQWYKNTRARFRFLNVQCSCLFNEIKAFWKIYLWWSVLILWRSATNKSMNGKHCIALHCIDPTWGGILHYKFWVWLISKSMLHFGYYEVVEKTLKV